MGDVRIVFTDGNLNPALPGQDHISGLVIYTDAEVEGFSDDNIQPIFSPQQAEALGLTNDDSEQDVKVARYHIDEFFRQNPGAKLWVGLFPVPVTFDFAEMAALQRAANGECARIGICSLNLDDYGTTQVSAFQAVCATLDTEHLPTFVYFEPKLANTVTLSNIATLATATNPNVALVIGADGAARGAALSEGQDRVGIIGAVLGLASRFLVHQSIAWVQRGNVVTGAELDVPAFLTGDLVKNQPATLLAELNTKRYLFLRKHQGISGTYFYDSPNANLQSSDYNAIERVMVRNKAARLLRAAYLPTLSGPITLEGGKIQKDVVAVLNNIGTRALEQMQREGEISEFRISVDPDQDIVNTGKLAITCKIVPVGVAREIDVEFSYTVQLS